MPVQANFDEVIQWLGDFLDSFDFNLPGKDRNLGRDLAHVFAGQIDARSAVESGWTGSEKWYPNDPAYALDKAATYGWPLYKPNYRTGQMLSHASLFGRTTVVDGKTVELRYGLNVAPNRTYSPLDNRSQSEVDADEAVTDVEKAEWNSEERPFFVVDDAVEEAVIEEADKALAQYILQFG